MKRFKNILLIHPFDKSTLERAATLARSNGARLTVLQVTQEVTGIDELVTAPGRAPIDLQDLVVKEYQSQLRRVVASIKRDGFRASSKVLVGTPFLEIIREVISRKRDLVIMTAEGKGGLKERLFGSTSLNLMRKCPCPVWVMKPSAPGRSRRILAAIDPDSMDSVRESLNALILQLAASLAESDGAELHIGHAWTALGESHLRGIASISEDEVLDYVRKEADGRRQALDGLLAKHTDGTAIVHMVKGAANAAIPEIARKMKADLIVMGTVCRTGIAGFVMGNTAETILDQVDCSVLTVKPEGFRTPVKLA